MGTVIERVEITHPRWRGRHSALRLAVTAAKTCLQRSGCDPDELDLVVNAGIFRDRNIGEPALAALIQDDIGANPEDPHAGGHGTFSFDIANGACGVLTALQVVDGFFRTHSIRRALVVASDADPGHGMSEHFPFSAAGAALLCGWADDDRGLSHVSWVNANDEASAGTFSATVGFADARNVLRFSESTAMDERFATAAAEAARTCLDAHSVRLSDLDMVVAAPARQGFRTALSNELGVPVARVGVAADERMHTAALAAAFEQQADRLTPDAHILLVCAGAGVTAGAALYRRSARVGYTADGVARTEARA
jgi:3-oxoacyl-[acyl-carrier-protein] synthase-3